MPTLMHASDILICKAGRLITTEALAAGLPLIMVNVIHGQEEGNAQFVIEGGAGVVAQSPLEVLEHIAHWLQGDGAELERVRVRAAALGQPNAAREVALLALNSATLRSSRRDGASAYDAEQTDALTQWLRRMGLA
jgi:1,2-diacylglycerol 3-beta-galactosyltransferase